MRSMQRWRQRRCGNGWPSKAPTTPQEYAAIIDREVTMWSDLVKAVGIKPE